MLASEPGASLPSRISVEKVVARMKAGEPMTVLDARSPKDWTESPLKVRGDIRIDRDRLHSDPSWPKDRLTVVYCT